jgi:beta-glucosidase
MSYSGRTTDYVTPLFPFGFGLTYTTFAYAHPDVRGDHRGGLDVTVTVHNTGSRTSQAVPQVYLGPSPNVPEPQAQRALADYTKVTLRPGESRRITVHVDGSQLAYWNTTTHSWLTPKGNRTVYIGSSSADLPLRATVSIR